MPDTLTGRALDAAIYRHVFYGKHTPEAWDYGDI